MYLLTALVTHRLLEGILYASVLPPPLLKGVQEGIRYPDSDPDPDPSSGTQTVQTAPDSSNKDQRVPSPLWSLLTMLTRNHVSWMSWDRERGRKKRCERWLFQTMGMEIFLTVVVAEFWIHTKCLKFDDANIGGGEQQRYLDEGKMRTKKSPKFTVNPKILPKHITNPHHNIS